MKIGYARVSMSDQNLDRQIDLLMKEGCERIYQEKGTGTRIDRSELNKMLESMRRGDTIVVAELTRLSRSVKDLILLVERFHEIGADIKSLKEPWLDTTTPQGRLLFSIFAGVSQFERDLIQERTVEGLNAARQEVLKSTCVCQEIADKLVGTQKVGYIFKRGSKMYEDKTCAVSEILKVTEISKATLYSYVKQRGLK